MNDEQLAVVLFAIYALNWQWTFRVQRVARGLLLTALDSSARHPELLGQLMTPVWTTAVWVGRFLWIGAIVFAWRAWGLWGVIIPVLYGLLVGTWIDMFSPWPSYKRLLADLRRRIEVGRAGLNALELLPTLDRVQAEVDAGARFESFTTGALVARAADAGARRAEHHDSPGNKE
jgi:hypothetical protein